MVALGQLVVFAIYTVQQAGVMLAVGAETIVLLMYLLHLHNGALSHAKYLRAARFAQRVGLGAILVSGLAAVGYHTAAGQLAVVEAPAFVFKWILIAGVVALYEVERYMDEHRMLYQTAVRGVAGGTWFALFLVHNIAPETTWPMLAAVYVAWMVAFGVVWSGFAALMTRRINVLKPTVKPAVPVTVKAMPVQPKPPVASVPTPKSTPKVVVHTPPPVQPAKVVSAPARASVAKAPEPVHPLPAVFHKELEAPHHVAAAPAPVHVAAAPAPVHMAPPPAPAPVHIAAAPAPVHHTAAPAPQPPKDEELPAIRVMPRTPEELATSNRSAVVEFKSA